MPTSPFFMMVGAAPLTPYTPWVTISSASFEVRVLSVTSKRVMTGKLSEKSSRVKEKGPSVACENRLPTMVRLTPQVLVMVPPPNTPSLFVAYAPSVFPFGTYSELGKLIYVG